MLMPDFQVVQILKKKIIFCKYCNYNNFHDIASVASTTNA